MIDLFNKGKVKELTEKLERTSNQCYILKQKLESFGKELIEIEDYKKLKEKEAKPLESLREVSNKFLELQDKTEDLIFHLSSKYTLTDVEDDRDPYLLPQVEVFVEKMQFATASLISTLQRSSEIEQVAKAKEMINKKEEKNNGL